MIGSKFTAADASLYFYRRCIGLPSDVLEQCVSRGYSLSAMAHLEKRPNSIIVKRELSDHAYHVDALVMVSRYKFVSRLHKTLRFRRLYHRAGLETIRLVPHLSNAVITATYHSKAIDDMAAVMFDEMR